MSCPPYTGAGGRGAGRYTTGWASSGEISAHDAARIVNEQSGRLGIWNSGREMGSTCAYDKIQQKNPISNSREPESAGNSR
jgi:hypothetical protein